MLLAGTTSYAQANSDTEGAHRESAKSRREARRAAYASKMNSIIEGRNYIFRPITMQNVATGTTHNIFAYYLYVGVDGNLLTLHIPVEFTSYVIDTINLDCYIEGYRATLNEGNWRISFSFMQGAERWFAEYFISTITGQARLALVTPRGVMRYLGTIEKG